MSDDRKGLTFELHMGMLTYRKYCHSLCRGGSSILGLPPPRRRILPLDASGLHLLDPKIFFFDKNIFAINVYELVLYRPFLVALLKIIK